MCLTYVLYLIEVNNRATFLFSCHRVENILSVNSQFSVKQVTMVLNYRNGSQQEKILLRAIVAEFERSGLEESSFYRIYEQHLALCRIEGCVNCSSHIYSSAVVHEKLYAVV